MMMLMVACTSRIRMMVVVVAWRCNVVVLVARRVFCSVLSTKKKKEYDCR